jgi:hypothetical protein
MRKIIVAPALVALLVSAEPASAQFDALGSGGFNLHKCVANATHILVVNPQGSVLEVWKGNARLGEVVPIHALANLTLTQSERRRGLGSTTHISFEAWPNETSGRERLILFLVKSDAPDPTNGLLNSWRPAFKSGFGASCAGVTPFGFVYVRPPPWIANMPPTGFYGSDHCFKEQVFELLNRPLPTVPKK